MQAETPMGAIAVEAPVQWIPIAPEASVAEAIHALLESSRSCSLLSHAPQTQDEQATAIDPPSRTLPNRSNPAQTAPPPPLPPRHPTPYPQAVLLVVENTPRLASSQNPRARSTLETDTGSRTRTNDAIGVVTATDLLRAQFLGFNLTRLTIAEITTPWQPGDLPESLAETLPETLPETLEPPAIPPPPSSPRMQFHLGLWSMLDWSILDWSIPNKLPRPSPPHTRNKPNSLKILSNPSHPNYHSSIEA
ncbi:MAG: hypothetical protein ACO4AJ_04985 [Prochlorothrix sp.]